MKEIDEDFKYFYEDKKFGPAKHREPVPEKKVEFYENKLPNSLLNYWREFGWCCFGNGLIWLVDPSSYADIVSLWLKNTPFETQDTYHLISLSAFGGMQLWGEKTANSLYIETAYGQIYPSDKSEKLTSKDGCESLIKNFFALMRKSKLDLEDNNGDYLFERCSFMLGELSQKEMYGFSPALVMGGEPELKNIRKVNAIVHLRFLATLGEKTIMPDFVKEHKNNESI